MLAVLQSYLPFNATVTGLLNNVAKSTGNAGNAGAKIFGWICILISMISIGVAILAMKRHQPSGLPWTVAIISLLIGGYFLNGIHAFQHIATSSGQQSLNSVLKGNG